MVPIIILIILAIFMLDEIAGLIRSLYVYFYTKAVKQETELSPIINYPEIILIIPALREQNLVNETVHYFTQLKYPPGKFLIVYVTSRKEAVQKLQNLSRVKKFYKDVCHVPVNRLNVSIKKKIRGIFPRSAETEIYGILCNKKIDKLAALEKLYLASPLTGELISKAIEKYRGPVRMNHIEYPFPEGGRASQLNWAIDYLENSNNLKNTHTGKIYIGTYDFDSRPDLRSLLYIPFALEKRHDINQEWPAMFQQTQIPYDQSGFQLEHIIAGSIVSGNTVFYVKRALDKELYKIIRKARVDAATLPSFIKALLRPVVYGIGAGMFIRLDTFKKIKKFSEPQEDLAIGYRLCILGEQIDPIPFVNFMQPYLNFRQIINGSGLSFYSALKINHERKYMADVIPHIRLTNFEKKSLVMKEYLDCFCSVTRLPFIVVLYIFLFFLWNHILTCCIIFITQLYLLPVCGIIILYLIKKSMYRQYQGMKANDFGMNRFRFFLMILTAPFQHIINFIFAFKGFWLFLKTKITGINFNRIKTER